MKHIIKIRLFLLLLLLACLCHTPTMAYTQPTLSAATIAGTDDENTEDDTGGTGDNTGEETGGDTGEDPGTTLPADREPADVAQYIWWIDDDFENPTPVTLTASNAVSSSIKDIDVSQLKAGLHTVYVMAADIYGRWGQINPFLFFIPQTTNEREAALNVTYCEYWFDDDFDNRKTATVKGTAINLEQESIAALAPGTHYLRYRVMNEQGVFSSPISHQFLVQGTPDVIADVEYCEAWIDEDYANRQQVTLNGTQGTIDFDTESLRPGLHTVYTHARNTNKRWGQVNSFVFFKPQPEETLPNATSITRWEYWFDDNFDQRKVSTASGTSFTLPEADKSLADFSRGIHYFYYRALNNEGVWSPARRHLFYYSGKDESGSSPLTGYRYVFNGQSYKGTINNESTYTFNKTITIPAVQTMPIEKDSCKFTFTTVNDKDTVRMQRNVGYLFAIQFKNKLGAWSNPIDTTFVMSQKDSVEVKTLAMESTVTFERPEAGLYCPFKTTLSKRGTFFLTPSEKCHILLFDADGNEQEEITPDDFSDGLSLGKYFEAGTYYGIIYNLVDDNASSSLSLKLGQADKVTPTPSIAFDNDSKTVTITNSLDPDVDTYYTLDGNDPTASTSETCMHYDAPFTVDRNCTVKAISKAAGYDASIIAKYEVKTFKVAKPRYTKNGLTVVLYCDTPDAKIYYTTDGSDPSGYGSTECVSGTSISVSTNITLKAIAKKDGYYDSDLLTAAIDVANDRLSAPTAVRDGNTLKLYCDDGADIYYTKTKGSKGTTPTTSSTKYDAANPITLTENCVVMAIAYQQGKLTSAVMEEKITDFKVATPTYSVDIATATVRLSCSESGARIYYILNPNEGDDPANGTAYPAEGLPFTNDMDIAFCAKKDYFNNSESVRKQIKRADYTCGAPAFVQDVDGYTDKAYGVTITSTTPDAVIWYTTDNTDPSTSDTKTKYTGKITVDGNCTIKAVATKDGEKFANAREFKISNFKVSAPTLASVGGTEVGQPVVKLSCTTMGAVIKYTTDGSDPKSYGNTYNDQAGITFNDDVTLKFVAIKANYLESDVVEETVVKDNYTCKPLKVTQTVTTEGDQPYNLTVISPDDAAIKYDINNEGTQSYDEAKGIVVSKNCNVTVWAEKPGWFNAPEQVVEITNFKVSAPKMKGVDVVNGTTGYVKLSCTTTGAQLWYNLDGVSYQYVETGIPFTNDINDLKVYATKADFITSTEVPLDIKKSYYQCEKPTVNQEVTEDGNYKLTVTTGTKDATVKYKVDNGSVETYNEATGIVVSKNCEVTVWAEKDNLFNSDEEKVTVGSFKVATPKIDHVDVKDGKTGYLYLSCGTPGATIWYVRSGNTLQYEAGKGIDFTSDMEGLKVYATKDGFIQSDTETMDIMVNNYRAKSPVIKPDCTDYVDYAYHVTIETAEDGATLMYKKGSAGMIYLENYQNYVEPIQVDGNCEIRAKAQVTNKFDSEEVKLEIENFQVEKPEFDKVVINDGKNAYIKLKCHTEGAKIQYCLDLTKLESPVDYNDETGIKFDQDEINIFAQAIKANYKNSGYNYNIAVSKADYLLGTPVINATKAADGKSYSVSITAEEGSEVWYTDNGNEPSIDTDNRKQYKDAFTVNRNCVIKAYATMIDKFDSEPAEPVRIDGLSVGDIDFHVENNELTISSEGALDIYYEIDNENVTEQSKKYESPILLEENCKVYALAVCGEDLDSKTGNYTVDWFACDEVTVEGFNGRYLRLACNTADATIYYSIDDGEEQVYTGTEFDVQGLTKVTARVEKNKLKWHSNDLKTPYIVPCYYAGDAVYVKESGNLENAFEWCDGFPAEKTELTVIGNVNHADLAFVKAKNRLQFLDMKEALVAEKSLPDEAFAGMDQLLCITLPDNFTTVGSCLLKGDSRLGAVIWNSTAAVPADLFDGVVHANALLFVGNANTANAPLRNKVVNGVADEIVLSDASSAEGNFYCPIEFTAKSITYEHAYGMETETGIGKCRGWEAISLPFDVQQMIHYDADRESLDHRKILPFAAEGNDDTPRFWLYSLDGGFTSASGIEANTPYIICMPNCKDYGDIYNLNGKVTFRSENVDVHPSQETHDGVQNSYRFVPNTQYVAQCDTVMALNIYQDYQGNPEGSVFVKNWRAVTPFEAYITSDDAEAMKAQMFRIDRYATAIDGWTAFAQRDIYSENGNLYINCQRDCVVRLYTTQGQLVRVLQLHAGLNEISGIARGIYLVNSVKIVVK